MNILIINGSPHGASSNTLKVSQAFAEGIVDAIGGTVKVLDVYKMKISGCIGCFLCWRETPGKCIFDDDEEIIVDHILASDIVIWSFPVYYFGMPSKVRAVLERQIPYTSPLMTGSEEKMINGGHKYRLVSEDKKFVLVSTCGFYYTQKIFQSVEAEFDMMYGEGGYEKIFVGEGELLNKQHLQKKLDAYLANIKQGGKEYAGSGITSETRAKIDKIFYPMNIYAQIADASWGMEKDAFKTEDGKTAARVEKIKNRFN